MTRQSSGQDLPALPPIVAELHFHQSNRASRLRLAAAAVAVAVGTSPRVHAMRVAYQPVPLGCTNVGLDWAASTWEGNGRQHATEHNHPRCTLADNVCYILLVTQELVRARVLGARPDKPSGAQDCFPRDVYVSRATGSWALRRRDMAAMEGEYDRIGRGMTFF